jgi:hypothetical protein
MAAGLQVDKATLNNQLGSTARMLAQAIVQIDALKSYLDGQTDQALINLGFLQAEVDDMKSAFADLAQLATIYRGTANLAAAKDFRTFSKRLLGTGL